MEPRETSREDTRGQGTNEAMAPSAVVTTMGVDETTVGRAVEGNLPSITHADVVRLILKKTSLLLSVTYHRSKSFGVRRYDRGSRRNI